MYVPMRALSFEEFPCRSACLAAVACLVSVWPGIAGFAAATTFVKASPDNGVDVSINGVENEDWGCGAAFFDYDGDGLMDVHETGTGIYVSPTDTGSDPQAADSDNDGIDDGSEVANGSDPNLFDLPTGVPVGRYTAAITALLLSWMGCAALGRRNRRAS